MCGEGAPEGEHKRPSALEVLPAQSPDRLVSLADLVEEAEGDGMPSARPDQVARHPPRLGLPPMRSSRVRSCRLGDADPNRAAARSSRPVSSSP